MNVKKIDSTPSQDELYRYKYLYFQSIDTYIICIWKKYQNQNINTADTINYNL